MTPPVGSESPVVRVVVINFDGGQMTIDCLASILASDYPSDRLDVVMVDNGSLDDVVERVHAELPQVRVIEPLANTGFAGGCNLGITAHGHADLVALVNNDAVVEPGWLRPLVAALDTDERVGAACPKILFAGRFQEAHVAVPDADFVPGDPRRLGVRVSAARLDGERHDERLEFDEGFHLPEPPHPPDDEEFARWSDLGGAVRIRSVGATPTGRLALRVSALAPRTLDVRSGDASPTVDAVAVGTTPQWVEVGLDPATFDVINNVGSNLYERGFGGDRGFLERDRGQFDEPADVFAWCGGAVLLRRDYLDEVGLFDEELFLYYEDTDLSWRGRLLGWDYRYVPTSVVRHRHAQSSGVGSPVFRFHTERNRLLVLAKNAPVRLAATQAVGAVQRLLVRTVRDVVVRPLTLRMPLRGEVAHQARVLRSYAAKLPAMIRARRATRPVVDRSSLLAWQTSKGLEVPASPERAA